MKVMILAAGRGERLRPLTDTCPKPLLSIGNDSLISRHIKQLKKSGFTDIVINHAWLGQQIEDGLGDGNDLGVSIKYSAEGELELETAGGIANALHLLGDQPFLVINGDVFTDFDFSQAKDIQQTLQENKKLAHVWLVPNPTHNPQGDFSINQQGLLIPKTKSSYTFSGMAVYQPGIFKKIPPKTRFTLTSLLNQHVLQNSIQAQLFSGFWMDIGTVERLESIKQMMRDNLEL